MSYRKGKTKKPARRVVYRTRHKMLKDLKEEDTTHGFMQRIKHQSPTPTSAVTPMSQLAFCGVLGDDINDSIQMTTTNYRIVSREVQNRVRNNRAATVASNPEAAANTLARSSNGSPFTQTDYHLDSGRWQSIHRIENHSSASPHTLIDAQNVESEGEPPVMHIPEQHDLQINYAHAGDTSFDGYARYEPFNHGIYENTVQAPQVWYRGEEGVHYQPPSSSQDTIYNPLSFAPPAPTQSTLLSSSWEENIEDPGLTLLQQYTEQR